MDRARRGRGIVRGRPVHQRCVVSAGHRGRAAAAHRRPLVRPGADRLSAHGRRRA